jgi:hypothetical protein
MAAWIAVIILILNGMLIPAIIVAVVAVFEQN